MSPVSNKFEGIPQQQSTTSSNTKSTLGPRVLPKLPQKVALRKIETIHHPSLDKAGLPPEVFQKSPPGTDTPQKAAAPERPQPADPPPKPQPVELPPKPGELPPKPQLSDLPPKPQLADLPPKPQLKDLPPKPHLADVPPRLGSAEAVPRPLGDTLARPQTQPP
ncbi:arf-GAP with SH3 domain, ANK repeat and PH domain-containing protein 1-like, partial [Hippocampus comes]